ncbi:MAG: ribonuclease [Butyrivibrio sp.]|uniref:ribonuclease domain-containing protein n=1 Tax=Butyrivibrio sp. TaxID=28121 RepID=UPI0025BDEC7F|nr:ribonuclease domain-containing protein [Butyrivibrio sp.]MBQ6589039.1 ribonuclease [Butyrivibrio sp.]
MRLWKWTKKFRGAALWMLLVFTLWITGCTDGSRGVVPQPVAPGVEKSVEAATEATTIYLETGSTAATTAVSEEVASVVATTVASEEVTSTIDEDGVYTSKDDVANYISVYGKLPSNFITKKEAKKLGWPGGSLEKYAPGKCIGGDYFGNYEGLLPTKKGRKYYECDIDTLGKSKRGAKRIIYSNDGLIYYTGNHYESFELLYGEP